MSQLQEDIIHCILETLNSTGEVSVRGLGLFSMHQDHALLDSTKSQFLPPQKYITLDNEAIVDDVQLCESYAKYKNISIFQAKVDLESWANTFINNLKSSNYKITIDHFGSFEWQQNHLSFQNKIESDENFGLQSLHFQPILKSEVAEKNTIIQKNIEDTELTKFQIQKKKSYWWLLLALLTLFLALLIPFQLFFPEYTPSWIQDKIDIYKGIEKKEVSFKQNSIYNYFENNFYNSFPTFTTQDTIPNKTVVIEKIDTITTTIKHSSPTPTGINPIYISNDSEVLNAKLAKMRSEYAAHNNSTVAEQNTRLPNIPKGHYFILHQTTQLEDGFKAQRKLTSDGLQAYIFPGENGLIYVGTPVKNTETLALQYEYFKDRYDFQPNIKEVIK